MQKATFSCFLRFLTFPIEFGFLIEMDKFLEVKICFQFCIWLQIKWEIQIS